MTIDLYRVSHSKVQAYFRCRKQFWFEYQSGLPRPEEPMNGPGIVGKGVHEALRVLCETGRAALGRNELEIYLRMPDHIALAGPGTEFYEIASRAYAEGCMVHDSLPSLDRWAEQEADVRSEKLGIQLSARVDRLDLLEGRKWQIIDWKTGRSDRDDATDAQLDIAHVAVRWQRRIPTSAVITAIAWNLRTGRRRVRELLLKDAAATLDKFAAIAERLQANNDRTATPGPYCSFCKWRPQCPEADRDAEPDWDDMEEDAPVVEDL